MKIRMTKSKRPVSQFKSVVLMLLAVISFSLACSNESEGILIDDGGLLPNGSTGFQTLTLTTPSHAIDIAPSEFICSINANGTVTHNYDHPNLLTYIRSEKRFELDRLIVTTDLENFADDSNLCDSEQDDYQLTYVSDESNFEITIHCLDLATTEVQDLVTKILTACSLENP